MRRLAALISSTIICLAFIIPIFSIDLGLDKKVISDEEKDRVWENIGLYALEKPLSGEKLTCFDVSGSGLIAVGVEETATHGKSVCIYDENWNFINRFYFDTAGSFLVAWDNEDLVIIFNRSSIAVKIDETGNCIELEKLEDNANNSIIKNDVFSLTKKTVGEKTYVLTNGNFLIDFFSPSYYTMKVIYSSGNETVLYENTQKQTIEIILIILFSCLFITVVTLGIIKEVKKASAEWEPKA